MKINNKEIPHLWEFEGDLYSEKMGENKFKTPIRKKYKWRFKQINTTSEFKASLRAGPFTWPGCFNVLFVCSDGELLCYSCARKNARQIIYSIKNNCSDGWKVEISCIEAVSADCAREVDPDLISNCSNCNKEFGELT